MRTYAKETQHWTGYQPFFPEEGRITAENGPEEAWWDWRGAKVHLDRYDLPHAPIKVLLIHGAGANGRIMAPFGVMLRKLGYAAVSPDMPGYGMTETPTSLVDHDRWAELVADLIDAELARDQTPIVVMGVSLGGMLSYHAVCKNPRVVGLIATTLADTGDLETRVALARNELLGRYGGWLLERFDWLVGAVPVPIRWVTKMYAISNQVEMVQRLEADPTAAGTWVPLHFLRTIMGARAPIQPEDFDTCPVLLVHPEVDHMTPIEASMRFYDRLRGDKQLVVLTGAGHMPLERPGIDELDAAVRAFLCALSPRAERRATP